MRKAKVYPYINKFTGEVQIMNKQQAKSLSEDWERPKIVRNDQGKKVFRFHINSPVTGRDGKVHMGTAVVDISENEEPVEVEGTDGDRDAK